MSDDDHKAEVPECKGVHDLAEADVTAVGGFGLLSLWRVKHVSFHFSCVTEP